MADDRTSERDLIMPALRILAQKGYRDVGMRAADLATELRRQIVPKEGDLVILTGRKDDRLSQVLRNLVSHRTLAKGGMAQYRKDPLTNEWWVNLTELGWATLGPNQTPIYRYKS